MAGCSSGAVVVSPIEQLLAKGTDTRSYTTDSRTRRYVHYVALSDEELREHARHTGPGNYDRYDRKMLLALLHNRYPCGYARLAC